MIILAEMDDENLTVESTTAEMATSTAKVFETTKFDPKTTTKPAKLDTTLLKTTTSYILDTELSDKTKKSNFSSPNYSVENQVEPTIKKELSQNTIFSTDYSVPKIVARKPTSKKKKIVLVGKKTFP